MLFHGLEIAVPGDVLHDLVVAAEPAAFEPRLGTGAVELRDFQEGRVLGGFEQSFGIDVRTEGCARADVDDARIDRRAAQGAGHPDPEWAAHRLVEVVGLAY